MDVVNGRPPFAVSKGDFDRILGLMSGTSLDGVDCVLTSFAGGAPRLRAHWFRPFSPGFRRRLLACASGEATSWETARLHHDLGRFYAAAARLGVGRKRVDAIGMHGQTVYHAPDGPAPATLQLGEPAYVAEELGVPVVANFRAADMAAGGQGAPLATLFHVRTFAVPGRHVCVQNLGGIGNVTSIDGRDLGMPSGRGVGSSWRASCGDNRFMAGPSVLSFDTGPGNLLIDGAVNRLSGGRRRFDFGGRLAARGQVSTACLERWLEDPFLRRKPPKSTGRERYGGTCLDRLWAEMDGVALGPADRVATLTEFTAQSIALNYRRHLPTLPDRVVLCGGGANNACLAMRIAAALRKVCPPVEVLRSVDLGWPVETVEGGAFALLAREFLLGRAGNLPETTGARRAVVCGQLACGRVAGASIGSEDWFHAKARRREG